MISSENIIQHEIIGLEAEIIRCSEKGLIGVAGKIIDETRQTMIVQRKDRRLIVPKNTAVFQIYLPNGEEIEVQGQVLLGRPEDRIKTRVRRSI